MERQIRPFRSVPSTITGRGKNMMSISSMRRALLYKLRFREIKSGSIAKRITYVLVDAFFCFLIALKGQQVQECQILVAA
jgi:hypothetical protein